MMLVDASFLVALANDKDQWHDAAARAAPAARAAAPWRTHALALGEVVAVLGPRVGGRATRDVYEAIRDTVEVALPTLEDLDAAMAHVLRHDGGLSLSDALFVVFAARAGDDRILSFDSGFDQAGLRRIPPQGPRRR